MGRRSNFERIPKDGHFTADDLAAEVWRAIPRALGYEVSSLGRIRSTDRVVDTAAGPRRYRGKIIATPSRNQLGHVKVIVRNNRKPFITYVHILVCEAFHGPRPEGHEVAHGDGDPANNRETNLRWATPSQNSADKELHGSLLKGDRHPGAILTARDVRQIRHLRKVGVTQLVIAKCFGVAVGTIKSIDQGKSWRSVQIDEPEATGKQRRVCFDCGRSMGHGAKWTLAQRNGVLTPVHRHCDNPNSYYPAGQTPIAPAPLLDFADRAGEAA